MKSYIYFYLWGGPFNAISRGETKAPEDIKQGARLVGKALAIPLLPLAALLSCSADNCWHTMDDYDTASYPFKDYPYPLEPDGNGGWIEHGKLVRYNQGLRYNGEATEGFVTVMPAGKGEEKTAVIDFDRYYDKPDSIRSIVQVLSDNEYNQILNKYPQYKKPNTLGKVFKLEDFYKALK